MALAAWQATIVDETGDIQTNAQIEVRVESSGGLAALYSDRDGLASIANPFTADDDGFARFYTAGNALRIVATKGAFSRTWRHVSVGLLGERDFIPGSLIAYDRTDAEIAAEVTPVNYAYQPGYVYRYGTNTTPGTTDMTAAINTAADVCREGGYTLQLPEEQCLVTASLDFTLIRVKGPGMDGSPHIKASSSQFDVITSVGGSCFEDFHVHGGWDGSTAGQNGDVFHFDNSAGNGFAYSINFKNVQIRNAKKRAIYWFQGGYSTLHRVQVNACGLHALELEGTSGTDACTTIYVTGQSVFSDCPNGYGIKITYGISLGFDGVITENTKGVQVNGSSNRALSFDNFYLENIDGYAFEFGTSSGIGLHFGTIYGGVETVQYPINWQNVHYGADGALVQSAIPYAGRIVQHDSGEQTTTTTGGVDITALTMSLAPGTWQLHATLAVQQSVGSDSISESAMNLTANSADSGFTKVTGSGFTDGAAFMRGTNQDAMRLNCFAVVQNANETAGNHFMRIKLTFSGGTVAYRAFVNAIKLQ